MTEKDKKSIEDAMVDSIAIEKVRDLVGDVTEVGLDSVLEAGLLKDIPLIGFVAKSVGAAFAIRDRIFAKKVLRFLVQLDDIPQHKKQEFVDSLKDEKERRKVGEAIILLLDRLEDMRKASLLGKLFAAYIIGDVSKRDYERLTYAISQVYLRDLITLIAASQNARIPSFPGQDLSRLGLLQVADDMQSEHGFMYRLNDMGKLLMDNVLKEWLQENHAEFDD